MSLPAQDHSQPEILSLDEFNVAIPRDVYDLLSKQYSVLDDNDGEEIKRHIDRLLKRMKRSPVDTCCRVNKIISSVKDVIHQLEEYFAELDGQHNNNSYSIQQHGTLPDLITIRTTTLASSNDVDLYHSTGPIKKICNQSKNDTSSAFSDTTNR